MIYNILFKNDTILPILLEYWIFDKLIYPNKKKQCILNSKIIKPDQECIIYTINNELYISSLFLKNDINNNIWKKNNLLNEMISIIRLNNNSNIENIITLSKFFNVINNETKIILHKI